jgi:exosortase
MTAHDRTRTLLNGLVILAFSLLYTPTIVSMVQRWSNADDYNHAFLIPFVSGYFVWLKRHQLAALVPKPRLGWGVPVVVLAGTMLAIGQLGHVVTLQHLSFFIMVIGLILLLLGTQLLRVLLLPVLYLLFMIPILDEVIDRIHWPFQVLAASIGSWTLQMLGYSVLREVQYLHLPRITLEVADLCSGVRYLISVIAVGIPLAYLTLRSWHRRALLIAFGIIIAILANSLRVSLIGIWVYHGAGTMIHGPLKLMQGLFVAWAGFITLFLGARLLADRPRSASSRSIDASLPPSKNATP